MTIALSPSDSGNSGATKTNKRRTMGVAKALSYAVFVAGCCCAMPNVALADESASDQAFGTLEILLRLYDDTRGLRWDTKTNWLKTEEVCDWYGVECYDDSDPRTAGHIRKLALGDNHLVGSIPSEIYELPLLQELVLRNNADLKVSFENIGSAEYLERLVISNTATSDLSGIGAAKSLKELHLTNLGLKGNMPSDLFDLRDLEALYANYNKFSGSIPDKIGQLTSIKELYLFKNNLSGQIPDEIAQCTDLEILSMAQNAFSGNLPKTLNKLTKLETLAIAREKGEEKGEGISGELPSFSALSSITELYFENQKISGEIPSDFLDSAPSQEKVTVDLTNNNLGGSVPESLAKLNRLSIYLTDNRISEVSGDLCEAIKDSAWMSGEVKDYGCHALLCPPSKFAPVEGRHTSDGGCQSCVENALRWGVSKCEAEDGSGEQSTDDRTILSKFYKDLGGQYWRTNTHWLNPKVDICNWHGIECDDNKKHVVRIDLKNNGLDGNVPADVWKLEKLEDLVLASNSLESMSFDGADKAKNIRFLDLTQADLTSIGGISALKDTPIKVLKLSSNTYEDDSPAEIFKVTHLRELYIAHTKWSGAIPKVIGDMTNLEKFDCYGNDLNGQIPSEFGLLTSLQSLILSENMFEGVLPEELNELTNLETFSMHQTTSNAGVGGKLLDFKNMRKLTKLHLDSNKLTGTLPATLLENTERGDERIEVSLSGNKFQGSIPTDWADRFDNLVIDLSDNEISELPTDFCESDGVLEWMNGAVEDYKCDGILCAPGSFNEYGRRTDDDSECRDCPDSGGAPYFGSKDCSSAPINDEVPIIKDFYYATGGSNWNNSKGWLTSQDHCNDWFGIECNSNGEIVSISLSNNKLSGNPPKSLFSLPKLNKIQLQSNEIDFSFEGIGQALNLQILYLSDIGLTSLDGIGEAKQLVTLHLTNNDISGTLPEELFQLTNLKELFMNYNRISGRIPSGLEKMTALEEVYLLRNRFEGQLPASIGALTNVKVLALTENKFTGTLPAELNDLTSLEVLAIQREGASSDDPDQNPEGVGISGPLLSFNKLTKLRQLYLGLNSLTGTIPFDFLDGVEDKSAPIDVDLISNKFTGRLPAALVQFDQMTIYAAGNELTSIADGLCLKDDWMKKQVAKFDCDAILCPPNTFSPYGRQLDDDTSCAPCADGTFAKYYGSFDCVGDSGNDSMDQRDILEDLYNSMGGENWLVDSNWLDSSVSICEWHGITCVSSNEESVKSIHLSQNHLEGTVPASIFQLPELKELNFARNTITMSYEGIDEATKLEYLNLDETEISTLSGIEGAKNLNLLHINANSFGGTFPQEITSLKSLAVLYMSDNDFSGGIPSGLKSLTNLVFFACSECNFSGEVPAWLGDLTTLEYLGLSGNSLTGALPEELELLTKLKHLDLSEQITRGGDGISGGVPALAGFTQLSELYLHRNKLNGEIPSNFLANIVSNFGSAVTVDLRWNEISGSIPGELATKNELNLFLSDNKIDTIPDELCSSSLNGGNSESEEGKCDFILCDKGTFNAIGRSQSDLSCEICPGQEDETLYYGSTQCGKNIEKFILNAFYIDLNGPDWTNSDGWLVHNEICDWYGITCYQDGVQKGKVKSIVLDDNNMNGELSNSIYDLSYLSHLELRGNNVTVPLDGISKLNYLDTLYLSETGMSSLAGIGQAKSLTTLHLTSNNLEGPLPDEFFELTNLEYVFLNYNKISSKISTSIGNLKQVKELFLFHNELTGGIPSEVGLLQNLQTLSFGENQLQGTIPAEIGNLKNLEVLSLQRESGVANAGGLGPGLHGSLPPFSGLPKLRELYLGDNSFTGDIPLAFLSGIEDKTGTVQVDLTLNKLTGTAPGLLSAFNDLRLYLAGNEIEGISNDLCKKDDWMDGEVANGCDAILCPPGKYNAYGRRVNDDKVCETCAYEDSAKFFGSVSCGPTDDVHGLSEREILRRFYHQTNGDSWKNRNNWMEDKVDICRWHGVHCASESGEGGDTVTKLELPANNLQGTIPPVIFHLPSLKILNLHDNGMDFSFQGVGVASDLEELYLQSTNVKSLKGIGKASSLKVLHLEENSFAGPIPDELYGLIGLRSLYLSDSGLTGTLSSSIGNLENLVEFYCHANDISGEIPNNVGQLSNLEVLLLSENNLYGTLPQSLNNLSSLKELNIDSFTRNNAGISGPLLSFNNLPKMRELHLGDNSLTGPIPDDFLEGVDNIDEVVNVNFRSNQLAGSLPGALERLNQLNIDLADNKITKITPNLCEKDDWMDFTVDDYSCDAILCPAGFYNKHGRASLGNPCQACDAVVTSPYMGSTICPGTEKEAEKQILKTFYLSTGGPKWKQNDGWMDDNTDICDWFGVSCRDGYTVESILLGSNNLIGTPPKEIFQLSNLKFLWLYSNPMDFRFDGIEKATKLTSLLLDSTGLTSLEGIGKASALVDLDVRFNRLDGTIPSEIHDLRFMESFLCGHNAFTGSIPPFKTNRRLHTLRMSDNFFTGEIPAFDVHTELTALDLSGNDLEGPLPTNLLQAANTKSSIFIDLSSNSITGTVPAELARFDVLTLYLRDNMIEGVSQQLCSKNEFNKGDVETYGCDAILCPKGTYAPNNGRASSDGGPCLKCDQALYHGSSECGEDLYKDSSAASNGAFSSILLGITTFFFGGFVYLLF